MKRVVVAAAALAVLAAAGCTSSTADPAPTTSTIIETQTETSTPPAPTIGPDSSGPTTAADASSCPYLGLPAAKDKVGMRLAKITVLKAGDATVGCRFYAEQGTPLSRSEHLPGPSQPVIEITSNKFPTAKDAHNAFVRLSENGQNVQQAEVAAGNTGLCFQTNFYPKDKGADWACTFNVGATMVLVKTVVTKPSFNAVQVTKAVAANF